MMLDNGTYNKVKLVHELSALAWFIEKHALKDAENAGDQACVAALTNLHRDLCAHLERLQNTVCSITQ